MTNPARQRISGWLRLLGFAAALLLLIIGLAACSAGSSAKPKAVVLPPPGAPPTPDWLATAAPQVKEAFVFAASHHDQMQYIPCYCGCGTVHSSNADCYYKWDGNSTIKDYEIHAFG